MKYTGSSRKNLAFERKATKITKPRAIIRLLTTGRMLERHRHFRIFKMLTLDIVMGAFEYAPTHMNPLFIHQNTAYDTSFVSTVHGKYVSILFVNKSKHGACLVSISSRKMWKKKLRLLIGAPHRANLRTRESLYPSEKTTWKQISFELQTI